MAPFTEPLPLINGFKERIDALHVNGMNLVQVTSNEGIHSSIGDRLFIGTNLGNLHIYNVDQDDEGKSFSSLVTSKSLSKKPLEQLGYIKDINSVVALSGEFTPYVLYSQPERKYQTLLSSFIHSPTSSHPVRFNNLGRHFRLQCTLQ